MNLTDSTNRVTTRSTLNRSSGNQWCRTRSGSSSLGVKGHLMSRIYYTAHWTPFNRSLIVGKIIIFSTNRFRTADYSVAAAPLTTTPPRRCQFYVCRSADTSFANITKSIMAKLYLYVYAFVCLSEWFNSGNTKSELWWINFYNSGKNEVKKLKF